MIESAMYKSPNVKDDNNNMTGTTIPDMGLITHDHAIHHPRTSHLPPYRMFSHVLEFHLESR